MFPNKSLGWLALICAFVTGVIIYPVIVLGLFAWASVTHTSGNIYIARTTLMESPVKGSAELIRMRLNDLGNLATSQRVLASTAQTLGDMGLKHTPQEILTAVEVTPVKDTSMLAIEVKLPDASDAKLAADVMSNELKNVYEKQHEHDDAKCELRTVDPAYVRLAPKPNSTKYALDLVTGPIAGPAAGLAVGLLLGIAIASILSRRKSVHDQTKESSFVQ